MPQFDKLNFINQIFWTFLFFISFYFILVGNYLPFFSKILKTRTKIFYIEIYNREIDKIIYKNLNDSLLYNNLDL